MLTVAAFLALLAALLLARKRERELAVANESKDEAWKTVELRNARVILLEGKYDRLLGEKAQTDSLNFSINATALIRISRLTKELTVLRAELKRKHRKSVPTT